MDPDLENLHKETFGFVLIIYKFVTKRAFVFVLIIYNLTTI